MLRSDSCDYSNAFIVVKERIVVIGTSKANKGNKKLKKIQEYKTFKNNAPFRLCLSKINNTFIDNAEDLGIVMPMYNPLEYSDNYSMTQDVNVTNETR